MSLLEPMTMPTRGASTSVSVSPPARSLIPRSSLPLAHGGHALHRAPGDVAPQLLALERDHVGGSIRGIPGGARVVAERGHVEDAPAGGDDVSVAQGGARVGDLDPRRDRVEARDHVALGGGL